MRTATIFIPTYNGQKYIKDCIEAVKSQEAPKGWSVEIIITDSSSTDKTVEIIKNYHDIRLNIISKDTFSHGGTRSEAARLARGEVVVYLTQDAIPASQDWLSYMLEPFELNQKIVAVFGKQIPREDAPTTIKREVSGVFSSLGPDHSLMTHRAVNLLSGKAVNPKATIFLSDVNAAYKRDYLLKKGFKKVDYAEDQLIGKQIIEDDGLYKVYSPFAAVIHSNDYGPFQYFYRKIDERAGMYKAVGIDLRTGKKQAIKNVIVQTIFDDLHSIRDTGLSISKKIKSVLFLNFLYNLSSNRAQLYDIKKIIYNKKLSLEKRKNGNR